MFHRSPHYRKHQAHDSLPRASGAYERAERSDSIGRTSATAKPSRPPGQGESICPTGHLCESASVTPKHLQGSNAKEKQHELA
jgi:hypothetical protein